MDNTKIHNFLTSLGYEEMESGLYRKGNVDIIIKILEHITN